MKNNQSVTFIESIGLYITVFFTGASVMVIELLGTRMIAPFYGASIYVWSSLISVTIVTFRRTGTLTFQSIPQTFRV